MHMVLKAVAATFALMILGGCASGPATRSGYLVDYSRMQQVSESDSVLVQAPPPGFDASRYHAVKIDEPHVMVIELSAEERAQLSNVFRQALIDEVGNRRPVVQTAGPGVLVVRSAITSASKANVALNVVTGILAYPVSRGGAAAEAEVLDGQTGKRIAALSWSRRGAKISQFTLPYTRLGEARAGLRAFADRLGALFESESSYPEDKKAPPP